MLVWRYMNFRYGAQSILEGKFKLARPSELNDAYELRGRCEGKFSGKVCEEVREYVKDHYKSVPLISADGCSKRSIEEINEVIDKEMECNFTRMLFLRKSMEERILLLCCSDGEYQDANVEQLMWAHYADKGKGVRVLLNLEDIGNKSFVIDRVNYTEEIPSVDVSKFEKLIDMSMLTPFLKHCAYTKGLGWEYEHEVRLLTGRQRDNVSEVLINGHLLYFLNVPKESILRIDFGPLTKPEDTDPFIRKVNKDDSLSHLRCCVAEMDLKCYRYNYVDYNREAVI